MNRGWEGVIQYPHLHPHQQLLRHHRPGAALRTSREEVVDLQVDRVAGREVVQEGDPLEVLAVLDPVVGRVREVDLDPDPEVEAGGPAPDLTPAVVLQVEMSQDTRVLKGKATTVEDHLPSPLHQNVGVVGGYNTDLLLEYRSMIFCLSSPHRGRYQRKDPPKRSL